MSVHPDPDARFIGGLLPLTLLEGTAPLTIMTD